MMLGNMRERGVRHVIAHCPNDAGRHRALSTYPTNTEVPSSDRSVEAQAARRRAGVGSAALPSGGFVLERESNPSPKRRDLSVFDFHIHFHHLRDAQVADRSRCSFDGFPTRLLPGGSAFANDDPIDALDLTLSQLLPLCAAMRALPANPTGTANFAASKPLNPSSKNIARTCCARARQQRHSRESLTFLSLARAAGEREHRRGRAALRLLLAWSSSKPDWGVAFAAAQRC
jgi:hypothetical protein